MGVVQADPLWVRELSGWLVSMQEGRFGLCRMLLWYRDGTEGDVVMPHPEYSRFERGLPTSVRARDDAFFAALVAHRFLPNERPRTGTSAPRL